MKWLWDTFLVVLLWALIVLLLVLEANPNWP